MTIPEQHQVKIARQTLKMSDVGARIMGGMSKPEARQVLAQIAQWTPERIDKYERTANQKETIHP